MDIQSILTQPAANSWCYAYGCDDDGPNNYFLILADSLCPPNQPMYCDVYINYTYYKTLTAYSIQADSSGSYSLFEFDIQDAIQESMITFPIWEYGLPFTDGPISPVATHGQPGSVLSSVYCMFRGSTFDSNGLLVPNGPVPVQGTATTAPVSGGGTPSNSFWEVNAAVRPDKQAYSTFAEIVAQTQYGTGSVLYLAQAYTLSNLPKQAMDFLFITQFNPLQAPEAYAQDSGLTPMVIMGFHAHTGLSSTVRNCRLYCIYKSDTVGAGAYTLWMGALELGAYLIPSGMADIIASVPALEGVINNPSTDGIFCVCLYDTDFGAWVWISPWYKCRNAGVEETRLFFQNAYGQWEAVSFVRSQNKFSATSAELFKPWAYDITGIPTSGRQRYNVRAQDAITLSATFPEPLMDWIKDLIMSPVVMMQVPQLVNGSTYTGLKPVKIIDNTITTKDTVSNGRYKYEVTIQIVPSIDYLTQRN